ncbi:hypothetical protein [Nocardia acidivorans]|uniref:hypothetical protein n=1 Tax=Nocardia acidivorans TaxID=404580 RepID=UPI0008323DB2|nr:hypothetical protein [Nocardia acidivorans]
MDPELDPAAAALLESLSEPTDSAELAALVLEAARIKGRLDRLDRLISGDEELWARLVTARGGDDTVLEVRIDSTLTEARQQATVFRQMLAEIVRRRGEDSGTGGYDPLDDL